jgi:hypothetical protein
VGYGDKRGDEIIVAQMNAIRDAINKATVVSSYQIVTFDQTTPEVSDGSEN